MAQKDAFIRDMKAEGDRTRKILARIPFEHADYSPHEKSAKLVPLARHVATISRWTGFTMDLEELDFAKPMPQVEPAQNTEQLLAQFEQFLAEAIEVLERSTDEMFEQPWSLRHGEMIFFTRPKNEIMREFVLSHIIHHRSQLAVYLRLLDVPVPGLYGPSADER